MVSRAGGCTQRVFSPVRGSAFGGKGVAALLVKEGSRHFCVTPRDKGVMSTCRWHGDALMAGRSRSGNGIDGYCDAEPQATLELR